LFETITDLFQSLCFTRLPSALIITSLLFRCSEVNKNTIIDYLGHIIDYIFLDLFPNVGNNTLINYLDNLIDYFVELIDYLIDLIDYRWLKLFSL